MYVRVSYHLVGLNERQKSWSKLQLKPGKEVQASSQGNPGHVPTSQVSKLKTSYAPWESALIPRVDAH